MVRISKEFSFISIQTRCCALKHDLQATSNFINHSQRKLNLITPPVLLLLTLKSAITPYGADVTPLHFVSHIFSKILGRKVGKRFMRQFGGTSWKKKAHCATPPAPSQLHACKIFSLLAGDTDGCVKGVKGRKNEWRNWHYVIFNHLNCQFIQNYSRITTHSRLVFLVLLIKVSPNVKRISIFTFQTVV